MLMITGLSAFVFELTAVPFVRNEGVLRVDIMYGLADGVVVVDCWKTDDDEAVSSGKCSISS